jgi:hypothetical protein
MKLSTHMPYGERRKPIDIEVCRTKLKVTTSKNRTKIRYFLAHLVFRPGELLSSLFVRHLSSVVRPSTFHILIFSSETTGPIATKLWWNGPWMAPFQNCVQ